MIQDASLQPSLFFYTSSLFLFYFVQNKYHWFTLSSSLLMFLCVSPTWHHCILSSAQILKEILECSLDLWDTDPILTLSFQCVLHYAIQQPRSFPSSCGRSRASVNVHSKHQNTSDLCDFNQGMVIGARWTGSRTSVYYWDFYTTVSRFYTKCCEKHKKNSVGRNIWVVSSEETQQTGSLQWPIQPLTAIVSRNTWNLEAWIQVSSCISTQSCITFSTGFCTDDGWDGLRSGLCGVQSICEDDVSCFLNHSFRVWAPWILVLSSWNVAVSLGKKKNIHGKTWSFIIFSSSADLIFWFWTWPLATGSVPDQHTAYTGL